MAAVFNAWQLDIVERIVVELESVESMDVKVTIIAITSMKTPHVVLIQPWTNPCCLMYQSSIQDNNQLVSYELHNLVEQQTTVPERLTPLSKKGHVKQVSS